MSNNGPLAACDRAASRIHWICAPKIRRKN